MLGKTFKLQLIVDLSTEQQQYLAGGKFQPNKLVKMSNVLGEGFPNMSSLNPYGSSGTSKKEEIINANNNTSGVILY
ncbi:hypothetical protein VB711_23070 [Cronbergia sp. UHCC 0137]|uniref:hypothetical protein n=1 Tax=Cronbergia sp. UHCC 0137 TaxID=3110239 RepID=UPI002B1F8C16|nr:hypothetical protein [Cronbergia sp. UHCC 0137]MEA5620698.1 hypothetical protein [Cronbergia sp. UHCC 0137]